MGRRRRFCTRLLRVLLLALLIGGVGWLTSIFLDGRGGTAAVAPLEADASAAAAANGLEPEAQEAAAPDGETVQLSAEQFESTLEREGAEVFRIRGARTSSDASGNVLLEQVEIDYPRGGDHYRLHADDATYSETTHATRLEGRVSLEGTNGLVVETEWMNLSPGGQVLTAADGSLFVSGAIAAVGDGLRIDFLREVAQFGRGVRVTGRTEGAGTAGGAGWTASDDRERDDAAQPLSLTADTMIYRWHDANLRVRGAAQARWSGMSLAARRMTLVLARERGDAIAALEASGRVVLQTPMAGDGDGTPSPTLASAPAASGLVLAGDALDVRFDAEQRPSRLLLSGKGSRGRGTLRLDDGDGARQQVQARVLDFHFVSGLPTRFAAQSDVVLDELQPPRGQTGGQTARSATSRAASGRFDGDGKLLELILEGGVELTDRARRDPLRAFADRARIDPATERVELFGEPGKLVLAEGEIEAPRAVFDRSACSEASGGVTIVLRGANENERTIRSEEATFCEDGDSRFRGAVEAQEGGVRLAAAQLRVSGDRKRMTASGGVRAAWLAPSAQRASADPGGGPKREDGSEANAAPAEWLVLSERLDYSEDDGKLRYGGGASATFGGQRLSCDELTVETVAAVGAAETRGPDPRAVHCLGNVRLEVNDPEDAAHNLSAAADRAVYLVPERLVRLAGKANARKGSDLLRGAGLIYWLDEGRYETIPLGGTGASAGSP